MADTTAVRKNVTVLFGDLVGSTSFGEQVDPEATRTVMADYFELLRSTIEDHAGTVAKFMGDGVMAVFGIPEIAEDDALRAVAAATELQQRFRSFADSVRERHGVELGLRVGVNTGELVISDDDADMVGDVLNTAARLEGACQPGRVLVGEDTWRLTRSSVTYEVLGEIRVKGKAEPIATFQVVADTDQVSDDVTPFVGRQSELADLQAVLDDACDDGAARLATVIGAPGVGKTRLAAELRAAHEARSFDLRFERRGSTTFTPIADLLRELTGTGSADDVARLVADHPEASSLADVLAALLGHGETRSTEESFWAVRRLLEMLSADGPLIVVVDDIQWAEPLFWDLLDHLVEWTQAPVFLLALARPELRELKPELAQAGRRVSAAIALEGLDAATTRELAARLLDTDELPGELIDRLPDSTEGNPLFVRELVQMLVDDGVLARSGDHWRLTIDVDAIEVPPTILSLLASRVERLPDDERQVVELASVIGTEFDRGTLAALATAETSARLGALIDRLRRKDLIEPSGAWAGDQPVYRFHHVLIRDAAYRRLLKAHRADLHERVGRHLEAAQATDELDVVIAHHYEQVHAYRSDLGTLDDKTLALAAEAARRLQSAAVRALSREDLLASGGYVLRALALTPDGEVRDDLLTLGCEALLESGDVARGAPVVEELTQRSTDPRLEAWADCFRAQLWSLTDSERLVEASQLADGAADRLSSLDDDAGVAKARLVRALILARLGRVGDCEAELDLALGAARAAGDRRRTVAVLGAAPLAALWGPSPVARAGGRCLDVLRLLRITTSSPAVEATSIRCQGMLEALRGRFDSAREKFETSRTMARDLGLRHGLYETELFEGFAELLAGDPVAAEPHLVLARDGLGALGIGADAGQASALLARALLRQGRTGEADTLASAALEAAGENRQTAVASRSVLGEIRVEQGRPDEARQLIAAALEIVERMDITIDHAIAQRSAARVADRLGDANDAQSHRAAAERLLANKGVTGLTEARSKRAIADTSEQGTRSDDGEAQRAAMVPPNSAWDVNEGLWSTWIADDRSGYLQLLASDFRARIHELGPKLAFSGDRYATADVLFESLADDRVHAIPNRLIAVRGDDLALIAMTFRDGTSSTTMHTVSQVRDGRALRADTFAEDQLGDALDELDRRWITLGAPADIVDTMIELRRSSTDGDYAAFRDLLADDFELVPHVQLMPIDGRSVDEFIESIRPQFGNGGVTTSIFTDVPAISDGAALTQFLLDAADGSGRPLWSLWVWESGRFTRAEIYELDDIELALARFEELRSMPPAALPEFSNAAFEWVLGFNAALNANDSERMRAMLHPEFEMLTESEFFTSELDAGEAVDWYLTGLATGQTVDEELIALRGNDHCLVRLFGRSDGYENEYLGVISIGDGQAIRHRWFDPETQLTEAQHDLDRVWLDSLGFAADHPMRRIAVAGYTVDPNELLSIAHPDIDYREHRQLSFVGGTHAELAANSESMVLVDHVIFPVAHRMSDNACLFRRHEVGIAGETSSFLLVTSLLDGLCITYDVYDLEDLDAAIARFDELTSDATSVARFDDLVGDTQSEPSLTNAAWEAALSFRDVFNARDMAAVAGCLGDQIRTINHVPMTQVMEEGDRDGFLTQISQMIDIGGTMTPELIAIRDDDLCLAHLTIEVDETPWERYVVVGAEDGQLTLTVWFDADQLIDALDELDRRWLPRTGRAHAVELFTRLSRAVHEGDAEAMRDCLSDDFLSVDHRRLGMGHRTADDLVSSAIFPELDERGALIKAQQYDRLESNAALICVHIAHRDQSSTFEWAVVRDDGQRLASIDLFEIDDLPAAQARYDELAAATVINPANVARAELANTASRLGDELAAAYGAGDVERLRRILATDFSWQSRTQFAAALDAPDRDRESYLDGVLGRIDEQPAPQIGGRQLLAIRGDDLYLARSVVQHGDDEIERLTVGRSANGQLVQIIQYDPDQLTEAHLELDRQWVELGGPVAIVEANRRYREVFAGVSEYRLEDLITEDFEAVDHRPLGLGVRSTDEWVESTAEFVGRTDVVIAAYYAIDGLHCLSSGSFVLRDHGEVLVDGLAVHSYTSDGRYRRLDLFEADQFTEARAWYDELAAAGTDAEQGPELTNRAWLCVQQYSAALDAGDRKRFLDLMTPGFLTVAEYRLNIGQQLGREEFADSLFAQRAQGEYREQDQLLAVRDDALCLVRTRMFIDDDVMEYLGVIRCEGDRLAGIVIFDERQLHEALFELGDQWLALGGPPEVVHFERAIRAAFRAGSGDPLRPVVTDDFVRVDHRQLSSGDWTIDQFVGSLEPLAEVGGADIVVSEVFDATSRGHVAKADFRAEDATWELLGVHVHEGMKTSRLELFEVAHLEQARARLRELVHDDSPAPPLANTSTAVAKQFELALEARDLNRLRGMLHPDYKRTMREKFRTQDTWGIDGEIDFLKGLADVKGVISLDPIAIRGDDLSAFRAVIGAEHTNVQAHAVAVVRDGLILEMITFDDAQLQETLDELDRQWVELGGSVPADRLDNSASSSAPELTNTCWSITRQCLAAFESFDGDRLLHITHPDFIQYSRRPLTEAAGASGYTRDVWIDRLEEYHRVGSRVSERPELIAIRDDDLCLFRSITTVDDDEIPYLGIAETAGGRLTRFTSYDLDQFDQAFSDLDTRWIELGGPADWVTQFHRIVAASRGDDHPEVRALLTEDFTSVDHRPIGMGERTADEWLRSLPPMDAGRTKLFLVASEAVSDTVWLGRYRMYSQDADWTTFLVVVQSRDGLVARLEDYALADMDDAWARFEELTRQSEQP